jgi:uncharacterized metal-binding protein YceD (DUF177 family)
MANVLRDRRTPSELAAAGQVIEINDKIGGFRRLAEIVAADLAALAPDRLTGNWRDSTVAGRLAFGFADAQRRLPKLDGELAVTLDAVCQRCLEPFRLPISVELRLLFANAAGAATNRDGYEVWELDEEAFAPIDLVEEALIMAMPLSAMHQDRALCVAPVELEQSAGETIRPFAALRSQLQKEP